MTPFETRTRDLQSRLGPGEVVVVFPSPNLYYLSGVWETPRERHLFGFVGPSGDPGMVVPSLSVNAVREETWIDDVRAYADDGDPMTVVADLVADRDWAVDQLYVDSTMWARFTQDLRAAFPDAAFGLADEYLSTLRVRKDDAELDALREAAAIADAVSVDIRSLGVDAVGLTESELAAEIEDRLAAKGGEGVSFETIVGAGPNGAHPHHTHGETVISAGDPVVLDFGTRVDRYPSDQTRTVVFGGDPPTGFVDAHEAVVAAQAAAVEAIEPGVSAASVDEAARAVLEDRGFGEAFIHRTGHGVGLDVHEEPYIVAGNDRVLEAGMVFSVEPGVYFDGEFGVRVEDLVVVTASGCERLNDSPRGWQSFESA